MAKKKTPTFEEALERLEAIVGRLEDPEITLDQTIDLFQEGKTLSELCRAQLMAVEQKVSRLIESEDGEPSLEEFDEEET